MQAVARIKRLRVGIAPSSFRSYATRYPRPKPGSAERPKPRVLDPLAHSPNATVTQLADEDLTFIHRPPPSAPSPSSFTTNPSSPLLRPPNGSYQGPLPPLVHNSDKIQTPEVPAETVAKMRKLRKEDPDKYTITFLAQTFNCPRPFVAMVAAINKKSIRNKKRKEKGQMDALRRESWSERKQLIHAIRQKKREFW